MAVCNQGSIHLAVLTVLLTGLSLALTARVAAAEFPLVVVAADGTGEFGPDTPGTTTSGIQEAMNACAERMSDLYIKGGPSAVYEVSETIHILPVNDFTIAGGNYTLKWIGPPDADMLWIDSGLDAHYRFGTLLYNGTAAALHLLPDTKSNVDNARVFIDSELTVDAVIASGPDAGTGIAIEPYEMGIGHADFTFWRIEGFRVGLDIRDSASDDRGFNFSRIVVGGARTDVDGGTLVRIAGTTRNCDFLIRLDVEPEAPDVIGVDLAGSNHTLEIELDGKFASGNALVLRESAKGNHVRIVQGDSLAVDPTTLVTDLADVPTNVIGPVVLDEPGQIEARTLPIATGTTEHVQRLYTAVATFADGVPSGLELTRGSTTLDVTGSHDVVLSSGDVLRITTEQELNLHLSPQPLGRRTWRTERNPRRPDGGRITPQGPMTAEQIADAVVLAWDGSGDFGWETPGTRTSGWQEAIDHAIATGRNLYAKGGWGGRTKGYPVYDTIRIPAAKNFVIDGGTYTMGYYGPPEGDLFVIDSAYECFYQFGLIGNMGNGAVIRVRPETPVDGVIGFRSSALRTSSIGQGGPDVTKFAGVGGIVFDTSHGAIRDNDFFFSAPMSARRVIICGMQGEPFEGNRLRASHLHSEAPMKDIVLLTVGPTCSRNVFDASMSVNGGPVPHAQGIVIYGSLNIIDIMVAGGLAPGKGIVLAPSASGNVVNLKPGPGIDAFGLVSDVAEAANNRIVTIGGPLPIREVSLAAGAPYYEQRLHPGTVRLPAPAVDALEDASVTHVRADGTVLPARSGRDFFPDVGDRLYWSQSTPERVTVIPYGAAIR